MNFSIDVEIAGKESIKIAATSVDEDFFDTYQIEFLEGQNFEKGAVNLKNVFILNEAAVKELELINPLGTIIKTEFLTGNPGMPLEKREGRVIGVVRNAHFESLHHAIKPMVFMVKPYWYYYINVRLDDNIKDGLAHLNKVWIEMFPDRPFEFYFLDSEFERLYEKENRMAKGLMAMGILAILTTSLGLFGYVRYASQQRTKEIAIRKVMGASLIQVLKIVSKDFVAAIIVANLISWPIVYYISNQWLQNFAFHIALSFLPFAITLGILLILSILTVFRQLFRFLKIDLSEVLRNE
jgi:putative ABC transport system permease protein